MGYIYTGEQGTPLRDIIEKLDNKDYQYIEFRCRWKYPNGEPADEFIGTCKYSDGELIPLDGDSYSLDDLYTEYEEWPGENGDSCLTVWEDGRYSETWEK